MGKLSPPKPNKVGGQKRGRGGGFPSLTKSFYEPIKKTEVIISNHYYTIEIISVIKKPPPPPSCLSRKGHWKNPFIRLFKGTKKLANTPIKKKIEFIKLILIIEKG